MKKKILFLLSLILIVSLGLLIRPSFSIVYAAVNYNNYYIENWNLKLDVQSDNSYLVEHTLKVQFGDFSNGRHKGIGLAIPLSQTVKFQENGKTRSQKYYFKISNVKADDGVNPNNNQLYDTTVDGGYFYIDLGGDEYVNGYNTSKDDRLITYRVSYKFEVGNDFVNSYDLFLYNLMSNEFPTPVYNFTFQIKFPKNFDVTPKFYKGYYGANEESEIPYAINKTNLTISSTEAISFSAHEGLTMKMDLPEGYFSDMPKFHVAVEIGVILGSLALAGIVLGIALSKASKNKPVRVVEFYPPEGYTPCDCDYVINGKLDPKRLVSLILYWASKGYVKINNDEDHKPKSITKIKDLDRTKSKLYENNLFDAFFPQDKTEYVFGGTDLTLSEQMAVSASTVKDLIGTRFKTESRVSHFMLGLISFIPMVIMMCIMFYRSKNGADLIMILCFMAMFFSIIASALYSSTYFVEDSDRKLNLPRVLAIMIMIVSLVFVVVSTPRGYDLAFARVFAYLPIAVFIIVGKNIFSMSSEMKSIYGRIWGFKHSITIMEKNRIEKLIKDDPSYFYDILPYAYALNVLDDFVKNFESVYMPTPQNCYVSTLDVHILCHSLNVQFAKSFVMPKVSTGGFKGGSGGFGGGFSGGGFGGAGGYGR